MSQHPTASNPQYGVSMLKAKIILSALAISVMGNGRISQFCPRLRLLSPLWMLWRRACSKYLQGRGGNHAGLFDCLRWSGFDWNGRQYGSDSGKQGSQFWGNCLSIFLQRIFFNLDERQRHHERQLCRLRWRDCLRQFFGDLRNRLVSSAPSRLLTSNME